MHCNNFLRFCSQIKLINRKAKHGKMYVPTDYEQFANTFSHAIMIIPSILASELLLPIRPSHESYWKYGNDSSAPSTYAAYEFCSQAFSASLICLFLVSSIYHWISWTQNSWKQHEFCGCAVRRPSLNKLFHFGDRTTIYFFIAGSYSPFLMLQEIHPDLQWMQWGVWVAAILGTLYTFLFLEKYKVLETISYVLIGLMPGYIAYMFDSSSVSTNQHFFLELVFNGGFFYLVGILVFKCDGIIPFAHAIWHLLVAAGAFSHFALIYRRFYL